jgi:flagellar biosynthesis protein FlhB
MEILHTMRKLSCRLHLFFRLFSVCNIAETMKQLEIKAILINTLYSIFNESSVGELISLNEYRID